MIAIILFILASICSAFMDMLINAFNLCIFSDPEKYNPKFWNYQVSWRNKWKNFGTSADGERFFGSSTFLVFLTDGWHLFKALFIGFIIAALISVAVSGLVVPLNSIWSIVGCYFGLYIIYGITFEITKKLITKKV